MQNAHSHILDLPVCMSCMSALLHMPCDPPERVGRHKLPLSIHANVLCGVVAVPGAKAAVTAATAAKSDTTSKHAAALALATH